jgi:adiponectin receptor
VAHESIHHDGHDTADAGRLKLQGERRLLTAREVPRWYTNDSSVRTGYRPVTASAWLCLDSLAYLHNETFNIYSHLIPAALALAGNWALHEFFSAKYPEASLTDRLVFHVNLLTAIVCFGTSSAYHTLLCHSELYASLWVRLDYVGILFQIFGSFTSGVYVGFYCEPALQTFYWSMVGAKVSVLSLCLVP